MLLFIGFFGYNTHMQSISVTHNQPEYSVSEISGALKRVVEDTFGYVRVRGEISGFKRAASGHLYLDLKDANAVLNAVCWKGVASKFTFKPEDGIEVICTGKLTTYAGRSNYQMVIESMEPAGAGALMALLERRKQALAAEGLFDASRKRALPYLPQVIGVITSPTGAVIQDILHRIADRFPLHVVVCPVRVQGEGAADEIARAIAGMNNLVEGGAVPRPDVLIVARGGGSLEDLWAFNEEIVVRAAAASQIPLISAVGHETDTTLIDYAADVRAPTPTAAAEMAVPVRQDLLLAVKQTGLRMEQAMRRHVQHSVTRLDGLVRGMPRPSHMLEYRQQRLDDRGQRLILAMPVVLQRQHARLEKIAARLLHPSQQLQMKQQHLHMVSLRLTQVMPQHLLQCVHRYERVAARVQPVTVLQRIKEYYQRVEQVHERVLRKTVQQLDSAQHRVQLVSQMLEQLNYQKVLDRGFVLVRTEKGDPITSAAALPSESAITLQFRDGIRRAYSSGE
jgi:exodeoxyribonuclease VII large subunit